MAHELGMSLGKANYVMKALLDRGLVKVQNFGKSKDRRGYVYYLTPAGVAAKAELTRKFLGLKMKEYDALKIEIERLRREAQAE
jgi:EPS-associated MarR family transcriptional regulator